MGLNRPVSRILLYPAIHLRSRDACVSTPGSSRRSRAYHVRRPGQIWLARTGSLPGRSLAGYRRWALTPPFHPSPVPCSDPPMGASHTGHRLVCSLLHLTWRRACAAPPLGFLARAAFPDPVSPRALASPDFALRPGRNPGTQRRVGRPRPSLNYTLLRQVLASERRARAPPRLRRTILVGVRRNSTLSVPFQCFCQRGSSPTVGSNQMPGPSGSITPS